MTKIYRFNNMLHQGVGGDYGHIGDSSNGNGDAGLS